MHEQANVLGSSSIEILCAGSEVTAQPDPFAREAKFLSESKALGRDVRVMLEGVDKFGNLFGQVTIFAPPPPQTPLCLVHSICCSNLGMAAAPQPCNAAEAEGSFGHACLAST